MDQRIVIRPEPLASPVSRGLIAELDAELSARYPEPGATFFALDPKEVAEGAGAFLVAWAGDVPVGCGAIRRIDSASGELKRMYVAPAVRGRGVGRTLLDALESEARRLGFTRLLLETGCRQEAAIALYQRAGYQPIPCYGKYRESPLSRCMAKALHSA